MRNGSYYIRDRSQVLSDLLVRTIEQGGGKIIYREKAEGISLKDGAVKSISNSLGERIMMSLNSFNSSKSLSPVTRYRALAPRAHASTWSSSLSRHIPLIPSIDDTAPSAAFKTR